MHARQMYLSWHHIGANPFVSNHDVTANGIPAPKIAWCDPFHQFHPQSFIRYALRYCCSTARLSVTILRM